MEADPREQNDMTTRGVSRLMGLKAGVACAVAMAGAAFGQLDHPALAEEPQAPAQPAPQATPPAPPAPVPVPVANTAPPLSISPSTPGPGGSMRLDIGYVEPGMVIQREVQVTNNGPTELTVTRTDSSCACTVAALSDRVIPPGGSITLKVSYDADTNIGIIQKEVRVFCEGYTQPYRFYVWGEKNFAVRISSGPVMALIGPKGVINLESTMKMPFKILAVNGKPPSYVDFDPAKDEPRAVYILNYDFTGLSAQDHPRWVVIETDHPRAEMMELRVFYPGLEARFPVKALWNSVTERVLLNHVKSGEEREFEIELGGTLPEGAELKFESSNPQVTVRMIEKTDPAGAGKDGKAKLVFKTAEGVTGFVHSIITIRVGEDTSGFEIFARVDQ